MASSFPPEKFITCTYTYRKTKRQKKSLASLSLVFGIDGHISNVERIGFRELLRRVRGTIINMPKANATNRLVCIFKGVIDTLTC